MKAENIYHAVPVDHITVGDYSIVPIRLQDIYLIKQWRNEQIKVLRQKNVLTDEDQLNYYNNHILPSFQQVEPRQVLFTFMLNSECIGYGGLVHISWEDKRAEVSFLLSTGRAKKSEVYETDFLAFLWLVKELAFRRLSFNRLFTETYDIRDYQVRLLEKAGFVIEGRMREHVIIDNVPVDSILQGCLKSNDAA